MLNTTHSIETPEGIDLSLEIAGPIVRLYAFLIDSSIRIGVQIALALIFGYLGKFGTGILLINFFLLEWFYPIFFEVYKNGQTPGKKMMGILVLRDDGTPVSWSSSLTRNLLRVADFLPVGYMSGLFSMLMNKNFKRMGDLAAGTIVVYQHETVKFSSIPQRQPRTLPFPLTLDEQTAIVSFAERKEQISVERQEELAGILAPITGKNGKQATEELYKIANGLVGTP